jgi:7-cyano-7-deazaguanine synthase
MKTLKTLIMLSGGLDSTTALAEAIKNGDKAKAVYFNYGQENLKWELAAARRISIYFDVDFEVINLEGIAESFLGLSKA